MTLTNVFIPLLLLVSFQSFGQESAIHCAKRDHRTHTLKSATLNIGQIAETEKYDVHFYQLDLTMTNVSTSLSGTGSIHATAKQPLDSALFELFSTLNITEIRVNGSPIGYSRVSSAVKVPVYALANESFIIDVDYNGTPPTAQTIDDPPRLCAASPVWKLLQPQQELTAGLE